MAESSSSEAPSSEAPSFDADVLRHLFAGIALCLALFSPRLASDGALYHEILRSLAIDGDVNIANERELHTWRYVSIFPSDGAGRVILLLPIFGAGLYELLCALRRRPRLLAAAMALSGMAVIWNFSLMGHYYLTRLSVPGNRVGPMQLLEVSLSRGPMLMGELVSKGLLQSLVVAPSRSSLAKVLLFLAALAVAGLFLVGARRLLPVLVALLPIVILAVVAGFLTLDAYFLKMLVAERNLQVVPIAPPSKGEPGLSTTHLALCRGVPYEGGRNGFLLAPHRSGYQVRQPSYPPGTLTPPLLKESFHEAAPPFLFDAHGRDASAIELVLGLQGELKPGSDFLEVRLDPGLRIVLSRGKRTIRARPQGIAVRRVSRLQKRDGDSERVVSLALDFGEPRLVLKVAIDRIEGAPPIVLRGLALRTP